MSYVHQLEAGKRTASDAVKTLVRIVQEQIDAGLLPERPNQGALPGDPLPYKVQGMHKVPIVSWAHAGEAVSYEELPTHWQNSITSECRDPHSFAVILEGDSMRSTNPGLSFEPGDYIVAQPSETAYSGCFVVAKFVNDGIIFRRFETTGEKVRLVPLNERYPVSEHTKDEFHWIYPVFARVTHLWSR